MISSDVITASVIQTGPAPTDTSDWFQLSIDTTKAGSANDTMVIPLVSGEDYDFVIRWGDGVVENYSGSALTSITHTYQNTGTYTVQILGDFPSIYLH